MNIMFCKLTFCFKYICILIKLKIKYLISYWWESPCLADICLLVLLKDESVVCSLDLGERNWAPRAQHLGRHSLSGAHPAVVWTWEWLPSYICTLDDPFAHPSPGFTLYFPSSSFYSYFIHANHTTQAIKTIRYRSKVESISCA